MSASLHGAEGLCHPRAVQPRPFLVVILVAITTAASGCRAHTQYFRGVDRGIFTTTELEALGTESMATEATNLVEAARPEPAVDWLQPTRLTSEGLQGRAEWTPDGARILFQSVRTGDKGANPWEQTYLMQADGSSQRRITPGIGKTHGAVVVPGTGDEFVVAFGSTLHTGVTPPRDLAAVGDSADHDMELVRQTLSTGALDTLAGGPGFDGEPHFCADGSAFAFTSARTGDLEVYIQRGDELLKVTQRAGPDESPRLSPDCSRITWVRRLESGSELVLAGVESPTPNSLVTAEVAIHTPSFSADGTQVLFASDLAAPGGQLDLFSVSVESGDVRRLTNSEASERTPRPSPDGSTILFSSDAEGSPQLYVAPWTPASGVPWRPAAQEGPP